MMATNQNKPSVIAKLMGLDEAPPKQQPVYRKQRVLSEKYLQKSASICSLEKRSIKVRQKNRIIKENSNHSFNGMQGLKPRIADFQTGVIEDRNDLSKFNSPAKLISLSLHDSPRTTFTWEFKKKLLERSKRTKVLEDIRSSKRVCNVGQAPIIVDLESKKRSDLGTRVVISSNEGWKDKSVTKLPIFKRFDLSPSSNTKFKKMSKGDFKSSSERHNNVPTKESCLSCPSDVSLEKDPPCEESFTSLNCIDFDDEFTRSTCEAYQPSPNSVLEPDNSSSSEYDDNVTTDLHGLWMKLQMLKSESEENRSKSEIVTLSDGDSTERSSLSVGQITKPQSQEFSYVTDVLNELGFHDDSVELSFQKWHSLKYMTNPLIFETLEKKYIKQESWNKVNRRLLFDHINLGMSCILKPHVYLKPLKRKMSTILSRDIVIEELWNVLLSQEKEVNVDLSEKVVGKEPWLELGDEVDSIVEEIEAFLFNELVMELVAISRLFTFFCNVYKNVYEK